MERENGLTTIYNSVPLMILDSLDTIYDAGVYTIRLDFTLKKNSIKKYKKFTMIMQETYLKQMLINS